MAIRPDSACLHSLNEIVADLFRERLRLEESIDRFFLFVWEAA